MVQVRIEHFLQKNLVKISSKLQISDVKTTLDFFCQAFDIKDGEQIFMQMDPIFHLD